MKAQHLVQPSVVAKIHAQQIVNIVQCFTTMFVWADSNSVMCREELFNAWLILVAGAPKYPFKQIIEISTWLSFPKHNNFSSIIAA